MTISIKNINTKYLNNKQNFSTVGLVAYISFVCIICVFVGIENAYAVYDLGEVKDKMIDKGWAFIDGIAPIVAVGGGLLGAFFARNMDWGARAVGFGTGTIGFGLAMQGVKAYYGL